ncbi:hypothetical protein Y032_0725g1856 [Ancylostoma ceylanicum]|nr:hypothetical protein Y032_0725g1856 [Ancylostoma ceylanicum]
MLTRRSAPSRRAVDAGGEYFLERLYIVRQLEQKHFLSPQEHEWLSVPGRRMCQLFGYDIPLKSQEA